MNKTILGATGIIAVVIVAGIVLLAGNNSPGETSHDMMADSSPAGASQKDSGTQEIDQITYKGFAVAQKSIRVKKGTKVTWTNQDSAMHDVTPDNETADFKASKLFGKGETYQTIFNTVGTYTYHCSPHPYMKGTIEVVE